MVLVIDSPKDPERAPLKPLASKLLHVLATSKNKVEPEWLPESITISSVLAGIDGVVPVPLGPVHQFVPVVPQFAGPVVALYQYFVAI